MKTTPLLLHTHTHARALSLTQQSTRYIGLGIKYFFCCHCSMKNWKLLSKCSKHYEICLSVGCLVKLLLLAVFFHGQIKYLTRKVEIQRKNRRFCLKESDRLVIIRSGCRVRPCRHFSYLHVNLTCYWFQYHNRAHCYFQVKLPPYRATFFFSYNYY